MVICLERGADLHTAQLMPLPLTVSCHALIGLVPDKWPLNACVRARVTDRSADCLWLESAAARPKLKLLPRTVKEPVNTVVHTERNASIFGTGKPRESSRE